MGNHSPRPPQANSALNAMVRLIDPFHKELRRWCQLLYGQEKRLIDSKHGGVNGSNCWSPRKNHSLHRPCLMSSSWRSKSITPKVTDFWYNERLVVDPVHGKTLRRRQTKSIIRLLWQLLRGDWAAVFQQVSGTLRTECGWRRDNKNCWSTFECKDQCGWSNQRLICAALRNQANGQSGDQIFF